MWQKINPVLEEISKSIQSATIVWLVFSLIASIATKQFTVKSGTSLIAGIVGYWVGTGLGVLLIKKSRFMPDVTMPISYGLIIAFTCLGVTLF